MAQGNSRILHILPDDKFTDWAISQFERIAPEVNVFVVLSSKGDLKYVNSTNIEVCTRKEINLFLSDRHYSLLVLHSLPDPKILDLVPTDVIVLWIGMGYDYYTALMDKGLDTGLLLPKTKDVYFSRLKNRKKKITWRSVIKTFQLKKSVETIDLKKYYNKIQYFSPVLKEEFDQVKLMNSWFEARYLPWNYGNAEDHLGWKHNPSFNVGNDILIGNNAYPTNNHIELLDHIWKMELHQERRIIVPLSYGIPDYREDVIKYGKELFGKNFLPITDFLPLEEYGHLISSCEFVFMNHCRQQAMGNILSRLADGAKIYLRAENLAYKFLVDRGFAVFDMAQIEDQSLPESNPGVLTPLPLRDKIMNWRLVDKHWGKSSNDDLTRDVVSLIV